MFPLKQVVDYDRVEGQSMFPLKQVVDYDRVEGWAYNDDVRKPVIYGSRGRYSYLRTSSRLQLVIAQPHALSIQRLCEWILDLHTYTHTYTHPLCSF